MSIHPPLLNRLGFNVFATLLFGTAVLAIAGADLYLLARNEAPAVPLWYQWAIIVLATLLFGAVRLYFLIRLIRQRSWRGAGAMAVQIVLLGLVACLSLWISALGILGVSTNPPY